MGIAVLWIVFLAVVVGTALALGVLVREARQQLAARRSQAPDPAKAAGAKAGAPRRERAQPPTRPAPAAADGWSRRRGLHHLIPAGSASAPAPAGDERSSRGLSSLIPWARAADPVPADDEPRSRGLGGLIPSAPEVLEGELVVGEERGVRGLGRLFSGRTSAQSA